MSPAHHIFHDPGGRRRRIVKITLISAFVFIVALALYADRLFHQMPDIRPAPAYWQ